MNERTARLRQESLDADIDHEFQPLGDFLENLPGDLGPLAVEGQRAEEPAGTLDAHLRRLVDIQPVNADRQAFRAKPGPVTRLARLLGKITRQAGLDEFAVGLLEPPI